MSKFNLSESEKNRILGLHEPKKNKSLSYISEHAIIGEQQYGVNLPYPNEPIWYPCDDAIMANYPHAGDLDFAKKTYRNSYLGNVTNGSWTRERWIKMYTARDYFIKLCKGAYNEPGDDCAEKCAHRPRDPGNNYVTAVMTTYFDGQKCRSLSWGGGAWYGSDGMEKCKKCCEGKDIQDKTDIIHQKREDIGIGRNENCVTFKNLYQPTKGEYAYCKYGNQLPIGNITFGDYITIEDCCALDFADDVKGIEIEEVVEQYLDCVDITTRGIHCKWGDNLRIGTYTVGDYITIEDCCSIGKEDGIIDITISGGTENPNNNVPKKKFCSRYIPEPELLPITVPYDKKNNIRKCHKGENVRRIQQKLLEEGFNIGRTKDDSKFGILTYKAVKEYQRKYDLRVDGIVGPETWNHMFGDVDDIKGKEEIDTVITGNTEEIIKIIDKQIEKLSDKECRTILKDTSKDIKGFPGKYLEGNWPKTEEDETRLETIKYCFNMYTPGARIPVHTRRIKKTFRNNNIYDLRGKGNI